MKSTSATLSAAIATAILTLGLAACDTAAPPADTSAPAEVAPAAEPAPAVAATDPAQAPAIASLDGVLAGEHRSAENKARDQYRHPAETLAFFGFQPDHTVVEITPGGGGWYAEVLAPALREQGNYVGVIIDPTKVSNENAQKYYTEQNQKLRDKFLANPELYGNTTLLEIDPNAPALGPDGSADLVLTFRNVHNWMGANQAEGMFQAFFAVLKPGGVLGVVEHRAAEGAEVDPKSGYVAEARVIEMATAAGFELAEKSEINANPADTKDHANGVWTLPPTRNTPEGEDAAKYDAIGESDRMTLKFVKPGATDAAAPAADEESVPAGEAAPVDGQG